MRTNRGMLATVVLVVGALVAGVVLVVHYVFTAEYGDITRSTGDMILSAFSHPGFLVVVLLGLLALVLAPTPRLRVAAVVVPVVTLVGLVLLTPLALAQKFEQYASAPRCVLPDMGVGPGATAATESQEALDSVRHVGHFGGGGSMGLDGCDRRFLLTEDVAVLEHYRAALPAAGWTVTEDDGAHLRAERDDMAFEVVPCGDGGVVWAGRIHADGGATCNLSDQVQGH